jgi:hypothetical protein
MISTNKLYDAHIMNADDQLGKSEVNTWLKSYTLGGPDNRRDSKTSNREGARRMSVLNNRRESLKSPTLKPSGILIPSDVSIKIIFKE